MRRLIVSVGVVAWLGMGLVHAAPGSWVLWGRSVNVQGLLDGTDLTPMSPWEVLGLFADATTCQRSWPTAITAGGQTVDDPRLVELLTSLMLRCLPAGTVPPASND